MSMGAPDRRTVPHPGQGDVVHVSRRSRDLGEAVRARRAATDTIHGSEVFYKPGIRARVALHWAADYGLFGPVRRCKLQGGTNTGIASFYIKKYAVTGTTLVLVNYGVYSANGFTDMFIDSVETSGVQFGIMLNGNPSVTYGSGRTVSKEHPHQPEQSDPAFKRLAEPILGSDQQSNPERKLGGHPAFG